MCALSGLDFKAARTQDRREAQRTQGKPVLQSFPARLIEESQELTLPHAHRATKTMSTGNAAYYDDYWQPRNGWSPSAGGPAKVEQRLFSKYLRPGKVCLDYGCGNAQRYGAFLTAEGVEYRGFDISPAAVESARGQGVDAQTLTPDGLTTLPDDSCDVAICFEVLEHLTDPPRALAEIRRVLRPGGVALLSVPNAALWTTRLEFLATGYFNPGGSPFTARTSPWIDPHLRFFNPRLFSRMVEESGFGIAGSTAEPFSLVSMPYLYRKTEWHPVLHAISKPLAFLGTSLPGIFSSRLFLEATKLAAPNAPHS